MVHLLRKIGALILLDYILTSVLLIHYVMLIDFLILSLIIESLSILLQVLCDSFSNKFLYEWF
jgi:hypothetical protein